MTRAALALALSGTGARVAQAAGDVAAGQRAFAPCASCHQVGPAARNGFGPSLNAVFGRKAGSLPGYNYSAAMRNSSIVWSEQSLAAFIKDADRTVPGTKMRFFSMGYGDGKIADLLAYLRTFDRSTTPVSDSTRSAPAAARRNG